MLAVRAARSARPRFRRHVLRDILDVALGQQLLMALGPGELGTIYIQRNGVDIPGAVSAPNVNYYLYTVVAADEGATLTARRENPSQDTTPPRRHAIGIRMASPNKIVITYNKTLSALPISAAQYTLGGTMATGKTITAATVVGSDVEITVSSNFVPGDVPTLTYTQSATDSLRVKDWAGNLAPNFSAVTVWNEYPLPATPAILVTDETANMTNGGGGFVWNGTSSVNACNLLTLAAFTSTHRAELLNTGWVEMQVTDSDAARRSIALMQTAGQTLGEMDHAVRVAGAVAQAYADNTAVGPSHTFTTPSSQCRVRIYRDMPSGEIHFDTSEDGAVTWTRRHTWVVVSNPDVEMFAWANSNSATVACIGVALQGFSDVGF